MSTIENLFKTYGDFKIEIPFWEIQDQGITALMGPSGSGKSSVLRILLGLDSCPGMKWIFAAEGLNKDSGEDLNQKSVSERRLGIVFQSYEIFPHMTVAENILFGAISRDRPEAEMTRDFKNYIEILSLGSLLERRSHHLSGGEKQRVALARALLSRPRLLLLDEPFSALDEELRLEAQRLVKVCVETSKIPALLITHDKTEAQNLAHTIVKMKAGKLQ